MQKSKRRILKGEIISGDSAVVDSANAAAVVLGAPADNTNVIVTAAAGVNVDNNAAGPVNNKTNNKTTIPTASPTVSNAPSSSEPTTYPPTVSPVLSESPVDAFVPENTVADAVVDIKTNKPTPKPTAAAAKQTTEKPTNNNKPTSGGGLALLIPENDEVVTVDTSTVNVELPVFRLDLVTTVATTNGSTNGGGRMLRATTAAHNTVSRTLQVFQPAQDTTLLSLTSYHLLSQYQKKMIGDAVSVELEIVDKVENVYDGSSIDSTLVMISYTFSGSTVYSTSSETETAAAVVAPTRAQLESATLDALTSVQGKHSLMRVLESSDDAVLNGVSDVDAVIVSGVKSLDASNVESSTTTLGQNSTTNEEGGGTISPLFPTLITLAFLSTFSLIGFLTYRKYQQYQHNNANNDYIHYQNKKSRNKLGLTVNTSPGSGKKKKSQYYDQFESPESSVVDTEGETPTSMDATNQHLNIASFPSMQDESDSNDERGWSSNSNSYASAPYDEESGSATGGYIMPFQLGMATQFANGIGIDMTSSIDTMNTNDVSRMEDATLDGLYSDKDSYFDGNTTVARSTDRNRQRGDSRDSFDTLNYSVDQSAFGQWDNGVGGGVCQTHIEGIEEAMVALNGGVGEDLDVEQERGDILQACAEKELMTDVTKIILENNVATEEDADVEVSKQEDVTEIIMENVIITESTNDNSQGIEDSPQQSEVSATDELYARITELEKMIHKTEGQFYQHEVDATSTPEPKGDYPKNLLSKHASADAHKSIYEETVDPASQSKANISAGVFTEETLGMINRNRLKATPPPSEGEFDEGVMEDAKTNSLLGWMEDTDSDEDSLLDKR